MPRLFFAAALLLLTAVPTLAQAAPGDAPNTAAAAPGVGRTRRAASGPEQRPHCGCAERADAGKRDRGGAAE